MDVFWGYGVIWTTLSYRFLSERGIGLLQCLALSGGVN